MSNSLKTMDGSALSRIPSEGPAFVVASLLTEGVHVLVGAPRTGKSWLALWIGLRVAKGAPLWNYECRKGEVLYLCLEDRHQSIQLRLQTLGEPAPEGFYCCDCAGTLSDGFIEQISGFLEGHRGTSLIVVDCLDCIRERQGYPRRYRDLAPLRELALRHHTAVLCVDDPPGRNVSLSDAPCGCVDSIFFLKRERRLGDHARLRCEGKNIQARDLDLKLEGMVWTVGEGRRHVPLTDGMSRGR